MSQPGFLPVVMSLRAIAALVYSHGFKKPSGGLPAAMSSSLSNAIMLANMGLEQLVPSTDFGLPSDMIPTFVPIAATSYTHSQNDEIYPNSRVALTG